MKLILKKGTTSKILHVFVQDSSSTTGAGLTGLTNASSGLVAYYVRPGDTGATQITLASATLGTWTSGGFKEVSSANMPGVYEFDPPDAVLASGANQAVVMLKGATNMAPVVLEIQLVDYDPQDATRLGLSALPNAAAEAAGGLYTRGTGAGQINQDSNGRIDVNVKAWIGGTIPAVNVTGVPKVDVVDWLGGAPNALTGGRVDASLGAILGTALTEGVAGRLKAAFTTFFDVAAPVLTTASVNQTGDSFARLGAPAGANVSADVAAVKSDTAGIKTKTDSLTFTAAGKVDANVRMVNSITVNGAGTSGSPWGP